MSAVERIKAICKEKHIAISKLEKDCGFANGYIRGLREGKLPSDRLFKVAEYLSVSPEYLQTGNNSEKESISGKKYYFDDETAEAAQEMFENPDLRALMSAGRGCKAEQIRLVAEMLREFKRTNPDG